MRRDPIKVTLPPEDPVAQSVVVPVEDVRLPDKAIIDAGVAKFLEYANLHWPLGRPTADEKFKLISFDYRNDYHLRVTLGMVYLAMMKAARP